MKTITLLKTMTLLFAVLILAGLGFVGYKITDLPSKIKAKQPILSEFLLLFPESIQSATACGDKLCLMTVGYEFGNRLIIVNPKASLVEAVILFRDYDEKAVR